MPGEVVYGVHLNAVDSDLEVAVVCGGLSRGAYVRDKLAGGDSLPLGNVQVACVAVNRDDSAVVLYHDAVAVAVVPLRQDNRAGFRGEYRSAVGRHDVHAAVVPP